MADSLPEILTDRGKEYGDFTDQAVVAQTLKNVMRSHYKWNNLSPHQREALDMIQHKIARIINGNPDFRDSWADIAGYATITADRCPKP